MKEMKEVHKLSFLMLKSYLIFTLMTSYYLRNDSCTKALQMCLYSSVRARGQSRTASQFLIKVEMKANAFVQDWKDCIVEKAPVLTLTDTGSVSRNTNETPKLCQELQSQNQEQFQNYSRHHWCHPKPTPPRNFIYCIMSCKWCSGGKGVQPVQGSV